MNCYQAKTGELTRHWYVIDATDQVVGRLAAQIAPILMGKHRPTYTPHIDTGDFVIVTNVDKVVFTGNKWQQKSYQRYTGHPGGQKEEAAWKLFQRQPDRILQLAVQRMMPKNKLGRHMLGKLKLYAARPPSPGPGAGPARRGQWPPGLRGDPVRAQARPQAATPSAPKPKEETAVAPSATETEAVAPSVVEATMAPALVETTPSVETPPVAATSAPAPVETMPSVETPPVAATSAPAPVETMPSAEAPPVAATSAPAPVETAPSAEAPPVAEATSAEPAPSDASRSSRSRCPLTRSRSTPPWASSSRRRSRPPAPSEVRLIDV